MDDVPLRDRVWAGTQEFRSLTSELLRTVARMSSDRKEDMAVPAHKIERQLSQLLSALLRKDAELNQFKAQRECKQTRPYTALCVCCDVGAH